MTPKQKIIHDLLITNSVTEVKRITGLHHTTIYGHIKDLLALKYIRRKSRGLYVSRVK